MPSRIGSNQFTRRMRFRRDEFDKGRDRITKDATRAALEAMAVNSPVDTSRLVSNWLVTRGGPSRDFVPAHTPGRRGSTRSQSLAETLALGRAEIEEFVADRDGDLFITNNTPYLRYRGGSDLAALGMSAAKQALAGVRLFK